MLALWSFFVKIRVFHVGSADPYGRFSLSFLHQFGTSASKPQHTPTRFTEKSFSSCLSPTMPFPPLHRGGFAIQTGLRDLNPSISSANIQTHNLLFLSAPFSCMLMISVGPSFHTAPELWNPPWQSDVVFHKPHHATFSSILVYKGQCSLWCFTSWQIGGVVTAPSSSTHNAAVKSPGFTLSKPGHYQKDALGKSRWQLKCPVTAWKLKTAGLCWMKLAKPLKLGKYRGRYICVTQTKKTLWSAEVFMRLIREILSFKIG